jgi:hypothetical protein
MTMHCEQARAALALWVGQDLTDAADRKALDEHLAGCPQCRREQVAFVATQQVLREAQQPEGPRVGLWPRVAARLAVWEARPQYQRFNVWVPTVAAALACSVLVGVAIFEVQHRSSPSNMLASQSRNLFETDPEFAASRGRVVTQQDLQRWQQALRESPLPTQQQARGPAPLPAPEW